MQEKKLGRGLDYLLSISKEDLKEDTKIEHIKIKDIRKNRFQPRENFSESALQDLTISIKENGVLQPILVRKDGLYYELIAGERRLKASDAIGNETIPSIVLDIPDNKLLQLALIENLQREDLTAIEEARAYQALLRLDNLTHEELAEKIGKSRSTITNALRLLDLPHEIQDNVSRGTISQGHARALLALDSKEEMLSVANKILLHNLTVRDVERLGKKVNSKKSIKTGKSNPTKDSVIINIEETLQNEYGTKVEIDVKGDTGKIIFHFFSKDDFARLYSTFLKDH